MQVTTYTAASGETLVHFEHSEASYIAFSGSDSYLRVWQVQWHTIIDQVIYFTGHCGEGGTVQQHQFPFVS
jgi:hypothetical protein